MFQADIAVVGLGVMSENLGLNLEHRGFAVAVFNRTVLAYFDGFRTARLLANLLQAQPDYFGAHTFDCIDRPGAFQANWTSISGRTS